MEAATRTGGHSAPVDLDQLLLGVDFHVEEGICLQDLYGGQCPVNYWADYFPRLELVLFGGDWSHLPPAFATREPTDAEWGGHVERWDRRHEKLVVASLRRRDFTIETAPDPVLNEVSNQVTARIERHAVRLIVKTTNIIKVLIQGPLIREGPFPPQ